MRPFSLSELGVVPKFRKTVLVECALVFLLAVAGCYLYFEPMRPTVLFGDDLANYLAYQAGEFGNIKNIFLETFANKYRPVFGLVWAGVVELAGIDLKKIFFINVLIHSLSTVLIFLVFINIPNVPRIISIAGALFVCTSRFSAYQVTQLTGLVEGVSTFFFFVAFYVLVLGAKKGFNFFLYTFSIAAITLAVFTHERYLAALPWFAVAWTLVGWTARKFRWLMILAIPFSIIALNVIIKKILGSPFLEGTSYIKISLVPGVSFLVNGAQALFSIFGFNYAPEHVGGLNLLSFDTGLNLIWISLIPLAFLVLMWIAFSRVDDKSPDKVIGPRLIIWLGILAVLMLIPPALTTRLDQRWLLVPQFLTIYVALIVIGQAHLTRRKTAITWTLIYCVSSIPLFFLLRPSMHKIFYIDSGDIATRVHQDVVPILSGSIDTPVRFVMREDHCSWTLLGGRFFEIYGGQSRPVRCFPSAQAMASATDREMASSQIRASDAASSLRYSFTMDSTGRFSSGQRALSCSIKPPESQGTISADGWIGSSATVKIKNCENVFNIAFFIPEDFGERTASIYANDIRLADIKIQPGKVIHQTFKLNGLESYAIKLTISATDHAPNIAGNISDVRELGAVVSVFSTLKNN